MQRENLDLGPGIDGPLVGQFGFVAILPTPCSWGWNAYSGIYAFNNPRMPTCVPWQESSRLNVHCKTSLHSNMRCVAEVAKDGIGIELL